VRGVTIKKLVDVVYSIYKCLEVSNSNIGIAGSVVCVVLATARTAALYKLCITIGIQGDINYSYSS
jgi:hypothetical protein